MAVYTSDSFGSLLTKALRYTGGAGVVAAIINAILYFIVGIPSDQTVKAANGVSVAIGATNFITMSILPALLAGLLFAIIAKFVPRPFLVFNIIATLIFIFMFFGPMDKILNATPKTLILMQVAHCVVGCAVLYALNNMWGAPEGEEDATA